MLSIYLICIKYFIRGILLNGLLFTFIEYTRMTKAMNIALFPDILVLQICKVEEVW